ERARLPGGAYRAELLLRGLHRTTDEYHLTDVEPFAELAKAIRAVPFGPGDLLKVDKTNPYTRCDVQQVRLRRGRPPGHPAQEDAILVMDEDGNEIIGVLLPTQRYVLTPGIERAQALAGHLETIGWGMGCVSKGPDAMKVRLMPPLIEELHDDDAGADPFLP